MSDNFNLTAVMEPRFLLTIQNEAVEVQPDFNLTLESKPLQLSVGLQGQKGDTGDIGPQGPVGPIGPPGADGVSFSFDATDTLSNQGLYDSEAVGFRLLTSDTGEIYVRLDPTGWSAPISLQGDTGPQGLTGATGATGPQGIQGPQGNPGINGRDFQIDTFDTVGNLVNYAAEPIGYSIVDPTTGLLYLKTGIGNSWTNGIQFVGAEGPQGPIGPQGLTGPQGPKGDRGTDFSFDAVGVFIQRNTYDNESEGFTFFASDLNAFYVRISNVPGQWGTAIQFTGPQGPQGPAGEASNGLSAYELAVQNGFSGTEIQWLDSLEATLVGSEVKTAYENESNTNAFTDAEKTKLASLESSLFLGTYVTLAALNTAHPISVVGSYAHVDAGAASNVEVYIWDDSDSQFVLQAGSGTAETAASVKTKYESNADTNAFTDAEKTKLVGIEANATADLTAAEIEALFDAYYGNTDWRTGGADGVDGVYRVIASLPTYGNDGGMGDRTADITLTSSFTFTGSLNNLVDGAFDTDISTSTYWNDGLPVVGGDITFQFTSSKRISGFKWTQSTSASHGTWKFQGSDDGVTFVDLSTDFTLGGAGSKEYILNTWDGITPYTYFRLLGVSGTTSNAPWLQEIEFLIQDGSIGFSAAIPTGGTTGQVLSKVDGTDFNTEWVDQSGGGQTQTAITAATYATVNNDFAGNRVKRINDATGCTVTVAAGHTDKEPLTLIQTGTGQITFAPDTGVTIQSADGNLKTRVQFSSATLVPDTDTADLYYLIGDLTT